MQPSVIENCTNNTVIINHVVFLFFSSSSSSSFLSSFFSFATLRQDRCWLGETNFDFDHVQHGVAPNATAIQINGNDHYILNTIVRDLSTC